MIDIPSKVSRFDWLSGRTVQDLGSTDDEQARYHIWQDLTTGEVAKTFEVHIHDELAPIPTYTELGDGQYAFDKI